MRLVIFNKELLVSRWIFVNIDLRDEGGRGGRVSTLPLINQMNWKLQNINLEALALQRNTRGTEKARWACFFFVQSHKKSQKKRNDGF